MREQARGEPMESIRKMMRIRRHSVRMAALLIGRNFVSELFSCIGGVCEEKYHYTRMTLPEVTS